MKKPKTLSSKQLLEFTLKSLENDKGIDIVSIDLVGRSSIADYMIVASGNTVRQVTAMANNLIKKYKEAGIKTPSPEGMSNGDWVLIDANDILVHIFRPEVRDFYSLEKMWEKSVEEITSDIIKN
ncbi:MAG: ribosome silencing factor [SAR116 cluster bacterium]|jgi:ribosome-associated protein|nr:ribosome silencing factor [SAR116 cluster bacterium]|tara:strand:+ start:152 stop:526 length:375 start_codon:yes stop_codon:yes gene_type:complete